jgi:hypothetical protein
MTRGGPETDGDSFLDTYKNSFLNTTCSDPPRSCFRRPLHRLRKSHRQSLGFRELAHASLLLRARWIAKTRQRYGAAKDWRCLIAGSTEKLMQEIPLGISLQADGEINAINLIEKEFWGLRLGFGRVAFSPNVGAVLRI